MPADIIIHGVDPTISEKDAEQVAFAVMATIHHMTDDRGTIPAPRPLYEYPLLRRRYAARGGEAKVTDAWLYHPKKPGVSLHPRTVPLTRLMLAQEMERLQKTFTNLTAGGKESIFDKVYGTGINNRFRQVVIDQAKAWKRLMAKIEAEGKPRGPTQDELQAIADIAEPANELERETEVVKMEPDKTDYAGISEEADPLADLQNFMVEKGVDPTVALSVVKLHSDGEVSASKLNLTPELAQKKQQIMETLRVYEMWTKQAKKAASAT